MPSRSPRIPAQVDDVPDDFGALVRDALTHLYDLAHLERHPLTRLVPSSEESLGLGRDLRRYLLDAVEEIRVSGPVASDDRARRPYHVLVRRYVDGYEIGEIIDYLNISLRQFQREHRKGFLALSSILWRRWQELARGDVKDTGLSAAERAEDAANRDQDAVRPATDADELGEGALRSMDMSARHALGGESLTDEVARLGVEPGEVALDGLVLEVVRTLGVLAAERQVVLQCQPESSAVVVWADPTLARQALLGLLNALITSHPVRVAISIRQDVSKGVVDVLVGPALAVDALPASYGLPERLEAAAELMEAQGGQLEPVRHGARLAGVVLTFPRVTRPLVLVVDDNPRLLHLFERYLVSEGYRFRGVTDVPSALEVRTVDRFEVIVLDIMMRDVDGWGLLQRLRSDPEVGRIPVIVCSVLDDRELAYALGAQGFLKKPVSRSQILDALRTALDASNRGVTRRVARSDNAPVSQGHPV